MASGRICARAIIAVMLSFGPGRPSCIVVALFAGIASAGCGGGSEEAPTHPVPRRAPVVVPVPWPDSESGGGPPSDVGSTVGYVARPCGFDLNGNGVRGEPSDCHVCDGTTTDVNDDGVQDRVFYVDCGTSDAAGEGSAAAPYPTIARAMDALAASTPGVVQAVCFRGRCQESVTPTRSGAVGTTVLEGFERPRLPVLLSGWDADADGMYPPFDEDDVAVLDGSNRDFAVVNTQAESRLEFAHFTARDYGRSCPPESGFLKPALGGPPVTHISVHDVELVDINRACAAAAGRSVFDLFLDGSPLSYLSVSNVSLADYGGHAIHGSGVGSTIVGPYRFDHLTVRPRGPRGGFAHGVKLWGYLDGVEILQSTFDANPADWSPCASRLDVADCEPTFAITAAQCSRGWLIRGNEFRDWKFAIGIQPDGGDRFCQGRDMDGIRIDANRISSDYEPWRLGDFGIRIEAGNRATVLAVDITDNQMSTSVGWESCVWSNAGVDSKAQEGLVRILGNACVGPINRYAALTLGAPDGEGGEAVHPQQWYEVRDNLFAQIGTVNVNTGYAVARLTLAGNVYDPDAGFSWSHDAPGEVVQPTLVQWSLLSGEEASSVACHAAQIAGVAVCR